MRVTAQYDGCNRQSCGSEALTREARAQAHTVHDTLKGNGLHTTTMADHRVRKQGPEGSRRVVAWQSSKEMQQAF